MDDNMLWYPSIQYKVGQNMASFQRLITRRTKVVKNHTWTRFNWDLQIF